VIISLDLEDQELHFLLKFGIAQRIHKTNDLLTNFSDLLLKLLLIKLNNRRRPAFGVGFFTLKCSNGSPCCSYGVDLALVPICVQIDVVILDEICMGQEVGHVLDLIVISLGLLGDLAKTHQFL